MAIETFQREDAGQGGHKPRQAQWLVYAAIVLVALMFAFEFFLQGGSQVVSPDGRHYLALAQGERHAYPYSVRLVKPFVVRCLTAATPLPVASAYQLLTFVELTAALLVLVLLLRRREAPVPTQLAIVLGVGMPMAVLYGHMPVLVDVLLVLLTVSVIAALDSGRLLVALLLVACAALTKEYGVLLALVWLMHARRQLSVWQSYGGAALPVLLLLGVMWVNAVPQPPMANGEERNFLALSVRYLLNLGDHVGSSLVKTLYIWLWAVLWPAFALSLLAIIEAVKRRAPLHRDQEDFAVLLLGAPLLLMGDWNRSLILLTPFACLASLTQPLMRARRFAWLLLLGGVTTPLNSFAFIERTPPALFLRAMTVLSLVASALLLWQIVRRLFQTPVAAPSLQRT